MVGPRGRISPSVQLLDSGDETIHINGLDLAISEVLGFAVPPTVVVAYHLHPNS